MTSSDDVRLDNPAYAALTGPHGRFAQVCGHARRYHADVSPFMALPSERSPADWLDALHLVPPGTYVGLLHDGAEAPESWTATQEFEVVQLTGEHVKGIDRPDAISLRTADVPEMLQLALQTEPGPFLDRTIELGDYIGIRRDGQLIAMAGERLHLEGWREISAVCTAPDHRGHGLASGLVSALIAGIQRHSERPFLHVLSTNTNAIRLYEQLGFRVRRSLTISVLTPRTR